MKEEILFSIIMPVYNAQGYVNLALENLKKIKKNIPIQAIIIDDGSNDFSGEIIQFFCRSNPWCEYIRIQHSGVSCARNKGLLQAKGEYILFLDADDQFDANALEILKEKLKSKPDILVFGAKIINHHPFIKMNDIEPSEKQYLAFDNKILFEEIGVRPYVWTCAYKNSFLINSGVMFDTDIVLGEDQLFQFGIFPKAETVQFISNKLYNYNFLWGETAVSKYAQDYDARLSKHILLIDKIIFQAKHFGTYETLKEDLLKWIADFLIMDLVQIKDVKKYIKKTRNIFKKHEINIWELNLTIRKRIKLLCLKNSVVFKLLRKKLM